MGFFKNTGVTKNAKFYMYKTITEWIIDAQSKGNFRFVSHHDFLGKVAGPTAFMNYSYKYAGFPYGDPTVENYMDDQVVHINDDLTVWFSMPVYIHRLAELPEFMRFASNNDNNRYCGQFCLSQVSDGVFDAIPESVTSIWIQNAYRKNKTIALPRVKTCGRMWINNVSQIKDFEGLGHIQIQGQITVKNCNKLESTKGLPGIFPQEVNDSSMYTIGFSGCKNLKDIDIVNTHPTTRIFFDSKMPIETITHLPSEFAYLLCNQITKEDLKKTGARIKYVEVGDYKGKGEDIINASTSANSETVVEKLKEMVKELESKKWRVFEDLRAVITAYGLHEWCLQNINARTYGYNVESPYVENGMIHSYDPVGEVVRYGYYGSGVRRECIKNGVCKILNNLGVGYTIINTNPRKKKEFEFIKIMK